MTSRKRSAAPTVAHDFSVGDAILVSHSDKDWWAAVVVRKRDRAPGQCEVQYRWQGRKAARNDAWLLTTDPALRVPDSASAIMKSWKGKQGHLRRDEYEVEERGEDDARQYLVRWSGWSALHDSWEPAESILDEQLIADFKATRDTRAAQRAQDGQSAKRAAQTAAQQEERRQRGLFAKHFIDYMRSKTLAELSREALTARAAAHVLFSPERCADWEFKALYECPDGEPKAQHLTEYKQTKGSRGAPTVAFEFHIISHRLLGLFVDCKDEGGARWEHATWPTRGRAKGDCVDSCMCQLSKCHVSQSARSSELCVTLKSACLWT